MNFDNFDNSRNLVSYDQNISLIIYVKGFDIRLVFTLPPSDSALQYKRCVHL